MAEDPKPDVDPQLNVKMPEGVELYDPDDMDYRRKEIHDMAMDGVKRSFPQTYGGIRLEVDNLHYADKDNYSHKEQKEALLKDRFLSRRLRGTVKLFDNKTGDQLDEKTTTLMQVPYLTNRGTYIHGGNEYVSLQQSRLLPGVYTRKQDNGSLQVAMNSRPGSGNSMRINFDPESAQYALSVGGSNLHLHSFLKDMNTPDDELKELWGEDVFKANSSRYDPRVFEKAYEKIVPRFLKPKGVLDKDQKRDLINMALERAKIHETVARRNLPNMFGMEKVAEWKAKAFGMEVAAKQLEKDIKDIPFAPDIEPEDLIKNSHFIEMEEEYLVKRSSEHEFDPDLNDDDMQENYNQIFSDDKPQLASMDHWPKEWIPEGSNPKGWIAWYLDYKSGKKTPDDDRQIKRWKAFKSRHGAQFVRNPTARRGFALRNWAIDPIKLLPDEDTQTRIQNEMEDYKNKKTVRYHLEKSGSVVDDDYVDMFLTKFNEARNGREE